MAGKKSPKKKAAKKKAAKKPAAKKAAAKQSPAEPAAGATPQAASKKKAAAKKKAPAKKPAKQPAKKKAPSKKPAAAAAEAAATTSGEAAAGAKSTSEATPDTEVKAALPAVLEDAVLEDAVLETATLETTTLETTTLETTALETTALETVPQPPAAPAAEAKAKVEEPEEPPAPTLPPMPKMPARRTDDVITLAFGATADQAFMVYALAAAKVETEERTYKLHRAEVADLAKAAERGKHDVVAFDFGAYTRIRSRYLVLTCGGSYGDQHGPCLVSRTPVRANEVNGLQVAVPSETHPAALALRLWLPRANLKLVPMPVPHIGLMVRAGKIRAGLLVNEDQVTYRNHNLVRVVDLGHWWGERTEGLPMATTGLGIRRDIDEELRGKIALDIKRSIAYALGHREEAMEWAAQYAGKHPTEALETLVSRYVNDLSLDCGERGRQAVRMLFDEAARKGFVDEAPHVFYAER